MRALTTIFGCLLVWIVASGWGMAQGVPYALSHWTCGAIVWPHAVPSYAEHFAKRLADAATAAFAFWGSALPEMAQAPFDPAEGFRIYDPATGSERLIPPLLWQGRTTRPVIVFAFAGEDDMRQTMGNTNLYGALWSHRPLSPMVFPNATNWIWSVGEGDRNIICASSADDDVLIHEFAHWFTYQWGFSIGINASQLPNYIVEGIAEATCAATRDAHAAVYARLQAYSWAQTKCLSGSIQGVMRYPVGESLVSYLVEALGIDGFLATLGDWSRSAGVMIDTYQLGWRESLGLSPFCPGEEPAADGE